MYNEISKGFDQGKDEIEINTTLTNMKPIHVKWIIDLYDRLRNDPEMVKKKKFKEPGITSAIEEDIDPVDLKRIQTKKFINNSAFKKHDIT